MKRTSMNTLVMQVQAATQTRNVVDTGTDKILLKEQVIHNHNHLAAQNRTNH